MQTGHHLEVHVLDSSAARYKTIFVIGCVIGALFALFAAIVASDPEAALHDSSSPLDDNDSDIVSTRIFRKSIPTGAVHAPSYLTDTHRDHHHTKQNLVNSHRGLTARATGQSICSARYSYCAGFCKY
jgi:hypothetical protein